MLANKSARMSFYLWDDYRCFQVIPDLRFPNWDVPLFFNCAKSTQGTSMRSRFASNWSVVIRDYHHVKTASNGNRTRTSEVSGVDRFPLHYSDTMVKVMVQNVLNYSNIFWLTQYKNHSFSTFKAREQNHFKKHGGRNSPRHFRRR